MYTRRKGKANRKEAENVVTCRLERILMDFCRLKGGYHSERKTFLFFVNGCDIIDNEICKSIENRNPLCSYGAA